MNHLTAVHVTYNAVFRKWQGYAICGDLSVNAHDDDVNTLVTALLAMLKEKQEAATKEV